ncbi:E3 ubiquitin-protein ligase At4g11680-like [Vitis vinifera]|nr:E3 ubiquitin-protein ligase At4g11680-like [Vitis vinifera]|eukprot:XP_019077610.1 PREDICTED: E3 ubiquitin-protein ligase At4g11680-like [Vitis vinifera]
MAPRNLTVTATADLFIFKAPPTRANSFNTLPTYRFKLKKNGTDAVGVLAAGTEQERAISEEDAVCCICLEKYVDNDELRELPCGHFFHKECVDEWLKINARCPLCQSEIARTHGASTFAAGSSQNPSERRTGSALDEDGGGHGSTVA